MTLEEFREKLRNPDRKTFKVYIIKNDPAFSKVYKQVMGKLIPYIDTI